MDSQNPNNNFPELIYRYLSGNASDVEVQMLESWVLENPKNKEEFLAFKKAWMLTGMQKEEGVIDVQKKWKETSEQIFKEAKTVDLKPKQSRRIWLRLAAAIALLLIASIWVFQNFPDSSSMIVNATNEIKNVELPDGSQVTLSQSSSLTYSSNDESKRKVDLKGNAFFDVKRDESLPFLINAQGLEIEVLGTSFLVDSRADAAAIEVIVQSGSVAVRFGTEEIILKPNEKAIFEKGNQQLEKVSNEDTNYRSLQTKVFTFEDAKLEEVVFALNRHFYKNISIENAGLKACEITAIYENKTLEAILEILEETLRGIQVKRVGDKITISGLSCN